MSSPLVLVTGANKGIGLAVAQILASEHSYNVLIGSRNKGFGDKVAADLRNKGLKASSVQLDLSSLSSIEAAVAKIDQDFGYLDVLVNNAGIMVDNRPLNTWDKFTQTFTTNVIGPAALTEGLLPLLRKAKKGPPRIVFVSTKMGSLQIATDKSTPFYATDFKSYDASKAAVNMLALNFARELDSSGGRVNAVCPGMVKTEANGFNEHGVSTEVGATRIVELAVVGEDGPTATFSDRNGLQPW